MSQSVAKAHYDTKAGYGISKRRLQSITAVAGDVSGKRVLDIGCGNGFLGVHIKTLGAEKVDGCDISSQAIAAAAKVLDSAIECDLDTDNLSNLFGDKKYDLIVATELIEHLFDPEAFLHKVKQLLKEKGELILTTPNVLVCTNRLRMFLGTFEYTETGLMDRGHVHFFTYDSLKKMLDQAGYDVVAEWNVYHPKVPYVIAKRFPNLFVFQSVFKCRVRQV